jgi:hypothetical protein
MSRDWLAGGPQKAYADFNLRTHWYTLHQTRIKGRAKALVKKDDMVVALWFKKYALMQLT